MLCLQQERSSTIDSCVSPPSVSISLPLVYSTIPMHHYVFMAFKRVAQTIINCIILIHHYTVCSDALFVGVLGEMLIMASACCLSLSKVVLPSYMRFLHHPLLFRITDYTFDALLLCVIFSFTIHKCEKQRFCQIF